MSRQTTSRLGWPQPAMEALVIVVATVGGAAVAALGVPAGWLSGAMIATAGMAVARLADPLSTTMRWAAMTLSGVAIGTAVTPQMLRSVAAYPVSIAWMSICVAISTYICARMLARLRGWSPATAFFSSVPGALSYVFSIASTEETADLARIAVVQVLRVFLLMGFVPLLVAESGVALGAGPSGPVDGALVIAAMVVIGAAAGFALEKLNVAAGMLFGAMVVSAIAHGTGVAPGRAPQLVTIAAQVLIGAWVGARFIGFDWSLFGRSAVAAIGSFLVATGIAGLFAIAASYALGLSFAQTLLAFSPGGLEAMTLLAFALGIDPLYVGAHHLARFLLISATLPLAYRLWMRQAKEETPKA